MTEVEHYCPGTCTTPNGHMAGILAVDSHQVLSTSPPSTFWHSANKTRSTPGTQATSQHPPHMCCVAAASQHSVQPAAAAQAAAGQVSAACSSLRSWSRPAGAAQQCRLHSSLQATAVQQTQDSNRGISTGSHAAPSLKSRPPRVHHCTEPTLQHWHRSLSAPGLLFCLSH